MITIILFSAGAFAAGLISGIFLNEFIRYKFSEESEYKFWNSEGAFSSDAEKFEPEKTE